MNHSQLVISLDFELIWGVFDKVDFRKKEPYFVNTRKLVPELLKCFENYDIHATWATVGMLFNKNWNQWMENIPDILPQYNNKTLSAYEFGSKNRNYISENLCFAHEIIDSIVHTDGQEMATHTYSHYYCLEDGQTKDAFREDLRKCIELAKPHKITLESLVFPRNQFNEKYLKICYELGIKNVRSNPKNWYWNNIEKDDLKTKIFRTGDAYIGSSDKSYRITELENNTSNNTPLAQRASRLLRPYTSNRILNTLKLDRIKTEMTMAAKRSEIYHLWWHPHNFGNDPERNLADLLLILDHYKFCHEKYGMVSNNMREINSLFHSEVE